MLRRHTGELSATWLCGLLALGLQINAVRAQPAEASAGVASAGVASAGVASAGVAAPAAPQPSPRVIRRELDRAEALLRARLQARPEYAELELMREPQRLLLRVPVRILFEPDSTKLRDSGGAAGVAATLDLVKELLRRRARLLAQILVYTDAIGDAGANLSFSQQRAQTLLAALQSRAVGPNRLLATGAGETLALSSNSTPEGRMQNRRVEIAFGLTLPAGPAPAP
jgi:outer membrane protein OmpA-like peptidoglycan-associated protein